MKYEQLPKWAQKELKNKVTKWYMEGPEAVSSRKYATELAQEYIKEHENFEIVRMGDGSETVDW